VRNLAFDAGVFRSRTVGVPVITVGNLTAGGTGKTPVVELLVRVLRQRGQRVGVISRGYGRASHGVVIVSDPEHVRVDAQAGGDEPVQIARKFPGVPVVVGERRYDAAVAIVEECGVRIVVSDDGFQHRWLHRDRDIVVVDGTRDVTAELMLPAGLRRESLHGLRRAHLVVLTGCRDDREISERSAALRPWFDGPIITVERYWESIEEPRSGTRFPVERLRGVACFMFSAIGNPERFATDLVSAGARLVGERRFRDHHRYTRHELGEIVQSAREARADVLVTTEKDFVRLHADPDAAKLLTGELLLWVPVLAARAVPAGTLEALVTELLEEVR
jgi:tetraacyldisaccharide 4'-kinase